MHLNTKLYLLEYMGSTHVIQENVRFFFLLFGWWLKIRLTKIAIALC